MSAKKTSASTQIGFQNDACKKALSADQIEGDSVTANQRVSSQHQVFRFYISKVFDLTSFDGKTIQLISILSPQVLFEQVCDGKDFPRFCVHNDSHNKLFDLRN